MPFKTPKSPYWQYNRQITVAGQSHRVRGSTGTRGKKDAERVEAEAIRAARDEILHGAPAPAIRITLDQLVGTYCDQVCVHQRSWITTRSLARNLLAGLDPRADASALTTADLVKYLAGRRAVVSNATVNRELELLKRAIRYVVRTLGMTAPDISWSELRLKEPPGRVRQLTVDEEARLFRHLRPDLRDLVRFLLITGCRVSSAVRLEWNDLDFQDRTIFFHDMKGEQEHAIPMTSELAALLGNLIRIPGQPRVFLYHRFTPRGPALRPFTTGGWTIPWWAALEAAGIKDFRRHDLRHTALSRMTKAKGIGMAQKLAGHADIATTSRYAHLEMDDLRDAMEDTSQTAARPARKNRKNATISGG